MASGDARLNDPPSLIGRDDEVRRVREALDAGRSAAIVGPAGIGKTSVAVAAASQVGRAVRRAVAVDYLQARPFLPLVRVVGHPIEPGDAAAVADQVRGALADAVLVLDDLQWSDADTIEALPALAATGPVVVTIRPGGDTARRAIKQMDTIGVVFDLGPLPKHACEEVTRRLLPRDPAAAAEVAAASGGNPLVAEVLAHTRADTASGRATTLRAVVEGCDHPARLTLARLALHDPTVTGDTAGVLQLVECRLAEITPDGAVHPAAAVFAEHALASLDRDERIALHRRRAQVVDDPGEAAMHWAAAGERDAAFALALEAADRATTDAARAQLLTLATENAPSDRLWSTTRRAVSTWIDLGDVEAAKPLVARLDAHEPPTASDAIDRELVQVRFAINARRWHDVLELTDRVLDGRADLHVEQRVAALVARAAAKGDLFDIHGAIEDAQRAIRLGDAHGVSTTHAGMILAAIDMVIGDDRWRHDLPAVFRRAARDHEYGTAFEAGRLGALARFFDGDIAGGVEACDEMQRLAASINNRSWERGARAIRASNLSLASLLAPDAVDELRGLVDDPAIGIHRHPTAILLAVAESDLGNIARADELIASATDATRAAEHRADGLLWARLEVAWNAGRFDECISVAEQLLEHGSPLDFGTPTASVVLRWVEWERHGTCTTSAGPLVVYRVQRGLLDESRALELLCTPGRAREAADAFLRAAELHDCYLRRNAVRCRWAAGEAMRTAGAMDEAALLLNDARRTCVEHGMIPLLRRVEASLRKTGAGPHQCGTTGSRAPSTLTVREREVLDLVRDGLSTAEIAARLRVSASTVESHIRKSMKRLGANNRREAALLADEPR